MSNPRSAFAAILWLVSLSVLLPSAGCNSSDSGACADGQLECGSFCCPDSSHYACVQGQCELTSCNTNLQLCGKGCIPITQNCCSQTAGTHCQTGETCCQDGCIPVGTSCCDNGSFC
ncbi:MAG TPA: hypothetical protein VGJ91_11855, partial [Polyangiaceae bacterium]